MTVPCHCVPLCHEPARNCAVDDCAATARTWRREGSTHHLVCVGHASSPAITVGGLALHLPEAEFPLHLIHFAPVIDA